MEIIDTIICIAVVLWYGSYAWARYRNRRR